MDFVEPVWMVHPNNHQPRLTLGWEDMKQTGKTWSQLVEPHLTPENSKALQPAQAEWILHGQGKKGGHDSIPVHPILYFGTDLAELRELGLRAEGTDNGSGDVDYS